MSDSYQAVYDAVRSRIHNADICAAVESAMSVANIGHYAMMAGDAVQLAAYEHQRPSVLYRPSLGLDGTMWCALYGDNLMDGVAGFGETPAAAMTAFDLAWLNDKTPAAIRKATETA